MRTALLLSGIWVAVSLVFFVARSFSGAVLFNNCMARIGFLQRDLGLPGSIVEGWLRGLAAMGLAAALALEVTRRLAAGPGRRSS